MKDKQVFYSGNFGIEIETDVTKSLQRVFEYLKNINGEKHLNIAPGVYFLSKANAHYCDVAISQLANKDEVLSKGFTEERLFALELKNISDLTIHARNVQFLVLDDISYLKIDNCHNLTIEGFEFFSDVPNLFKLTCKQKGKKFIDLVLSNESRYSCLNGKYYIGSEERKIPLSKDSERNRTFIKNIPGERYILRKTKNPFAGAREIEEVRPYRFRVMGDIDHNIKLGDKYYIYDDIRYNFAIYVKDAVDISFVDTAVHFSDSHSFLFQNTENIYINRIDTRAQDSLRLSALGDNIHFAACRGSILVKNSRLVGAKETAVCAKSNFYAVNYVSDEFNSAILYFDNNNEYGYNEFKKGDTVVFFNEQNEIIMSKTVKNSRLLTEYIIELIFVEDTKMKDAKISTLANLSVNPSLVEIHNNYVSDCAGVGIKLICLMASIHDNVINDTNEHAVEVLCDRSKAFAPALAKLSIYNNQFIRSSMADIIVHNDLNLDKTKKVFGMVEIYNNIFKKPRGCYMDLYDISQLTIKDNKTFNKFKKHSVIKNCNVIYQDK